MIRKLAGLIGLIAGGIMFVTLLPNLVSNFEQAMQVSGGVWEQTKSVITALWGAVYQPLVLVLLGLIALKDK